VKELKGDEGAQAAWQTASIQGGAKRFVDSMTPPDVAKEDCEQAGLGFLTA